MKPADRYQVRRNPTTRTWRIEDRRWAMQGRVITMVDGLPSERVASQVKAALTVAYWTGAEAVKDGEVII